MTSQRSTAAQNRRSFNAKEMTSSELLHLFVTLFAVLPAFSVALGEAAHADRGHLHHDRALDTAKTLPTAQLFGERTARAVGGIPQTEIFIDLK